jgi:hypothetical protein
MNTKFDELTKSMAQAVTRRQAIRRLGAGIVGAALAMLGIGTTQAQNYAGALCCTYLCRSDWVTPFYSRTCLKKGTSCPPPLNSNCVLYSARTVGNCNLCP